MTTTPPRFIAHVGLGYWGKNILRVLHELGVLHTACDTSLEIIAERAKAFRGVSYTTAIENILNNPEILAVTLATPAAAHYRLAKQFLLAGKDVYIEKPLALTVQQGEELVDLAERQKRVLMVGHILQYHPAVTKLKGLITAGVLGRIEYLYSNRLNIGKLRTEENILWSFAPHDISVILMLLGEEPVKVSATGGDYLNKGICDTTLTTIEFRNGIKGHIFVSWLHPFKEQKLVVVGSQAMAVFDDVSKEKLFLYPHKIEWKNGKVPVAQKADYQVIPTESKEPLKEELYHFIECVRDRKTPLTDGREGLRVLKVLEAAERSIAGRSSADIPPGSSGVFIHETACVDKGVLIGDETKVWHFSHILKGSRVGKRCVIGQNVVIGPDVEIGNRCKIQNNVSLYKGVRLEDEVFCGPSCVFTNVYNPRAFIERKHEFLPTLVKRGATIGANATIICGATIGRYAMIGAGAVIKKDVPDYAVVTGIPAKQIGWACRCGVTLKFLHAHATCPACGNQYQREANSLTVVREENNR